MSTQAVPAAETQPFDLPRLCRYFSELSPQPMLAVEGPDHVVRYLNPAFARLAGMPATDLIGHSFAEAIPRTADNGCLATLDRVFRAGRPEVLTEQEHRRTPPAYWSYEMWPIPGADEHPAGVMINVCDVTEAAIFRRHSRAMNEALVLSSVRQHELIDAIEQGARDRRELEAAIFHAQKLESLGVLAGGIAHDLNNLLTPVLGYAELATIALPEGSPAGPMLAEVAKNARRAADLVQQILAFAGKGKFVVQRVDLSGMVRDMTGLLGSSISRHARLVYELASDLPAVEADATQLCQVILNLVTNASEAIAEGHGVITVRTGRVPLANKLPYRSCVAWANDGWVAVGPTGADISRDDGATWTPLSREHFNSVSFAKTGEGWAVGPKGRIVRLGSPSK